MKNNRSLTRASRLREEHVSRFSDGYVISAIYAAFSELPKLDALYRVPADET